MTSTNCSQQHNKIAILKWIMFVVASEKVPRWKIENLFWLHCL